VSLKDGGYVKIYNIIIVLVTIFSNVTFGDTFFKDQWYLKNTGQEGNIKTADNHKEYYKGKTGFDINWSAEFVKSLPTKNEVIVAVVDSGVDVNHPDLKGRIWTNPECLTNRKQTICNGVNALSRNGDIKDQTGHGTHIAGIIAANINKFGISGMTGNNIKILPVKAWNANDKNQVGFKYKSKNKQFFYITDLIAGGILYAIRKGAKVINISSGWPAPFQTASMKKVMDLADKENVVIVAAAGNDNKEAPIFPCTHKSVICVGAVGRKGDTTLSSNYGGRVDLYAPGESIVSLYPKSTCAGLVNVSTKDDKQKECLKSYIESRHLRITGYERSSGTSFSAPMVAATVAMMFAQDPSLTINEIKARLYSTTKDLEDKKVYGNGMLDFKKALLAKDVFYTQPNFKNIFSIQLDNNNFKLNLPIENFGVEQENIDISISFDNENIALEKSEFKIDKLLKGSSTHLTLTGLVNKLDVDAFSKIRVTIKSSHFTKSFSNGIYFTRNFPKLVKTKKVDLNVSNFTKVFKKGKVANEHRLKSVIQNNEQNERFYFKELIDKKTRRLNILEIDILKNKSISKSIDLKKDLVVKNVFYRDIDLDGKKDYILYGYDKEFAEIFFYFYNSDLKELFKGKSRWTYSTTKYPISLFNPETGKTEAFWSLVKTDKFGTLSLPTRLINYDLPVEDKSGDILNDYALKTYGHLFYIKPIVAKDGKVNIQWRAFDSFNFVKDLMKKYKVDRRNNMSIFALKSDKETNSFTALMSIGMRGINKVIKIKKTGINLSTELLYDGYMSIPYNTWDRVDGNDIFMAITHRTLMRRYVLGNKTGKTMLRSNKWKDPLVNYKNSSLLSDGSLVSFIESRFSLNSFLEDGTVSKLPVNRESSFPNVAFSELIQPLKYSNMPSFLIDSTTILGNQEYIMTLDKSRGNKLIRPIKYSFYFPNNCVRIEELSVFSEKNYVSALCLSSANKISFNTFEID